MSFLAEPIKARICFSFRWGYCHRKHLTYFVAGIVVIVLVAVVVTTLALRRRNRIEREKQKSA